MLPHILVILGPTASGKSDLAVQLAKQLNGEVVSADSRQVYKKLNIGTGKITKKEMRGVPHHLLDVVHFNRKFSAADYKKHGEKAIEKILKKGKLPIICGGTGLYIDTLLGAVSLPEVAPDLKLRKTLETKSTEELFTLLKKLDPKRAETIDAHNPRRLVRAIEIATAIGSVPALSSITSTTPKYNVFKLGIKTEPDILKERINKRLAKDLKKGMIAEARALHASGLSYKRMRELGLEYARLADFLEKKITKEELTSLLQTEIYQYAKRQKTWFKKDKSITWISPSQLTSLPSSLQKWLKSSRSS